jgi:hypothetical protein
MSEFLPYKLHMAQPPYALTPISAYWEDLRFPATAVRVNPMAPEHPVLQLDPVGRLFRHNATDTVYLIAQLPHTYRPGSELRPHVHWCKTTAGPGNTGGVYWRLTYRWASIGAPIANAVSIGSAVPTVSDADTQNLHALTSLGKISGTGRKISDMLLMQLSRVHDNEADTYGASALLMEFDIHYQVSSPGSRSELVK